MKIFKLIFIFLLLSGLVFSAEKYDYVVALDGSGDFTSIQKALEACKIFPDQRITIHVKNGIYNEKVAVLSGNTQISIIGESVDKTIISFGDYFSKIDRGRNSTFYTSTLKVDASDFVLENITVENSAGPVGQALALHVEGDRCVFRNCRFSGNQDTVYAAGKFSRQYFYNCYIEGTTDFIFGEATAVFEQCSLHAKANSFLTAASTAEGKPFGFVFMDCKITAAPGVDKVFLGRPWRGFAKVAYLNCEMGPFIIPEGWDKWSNPDNEKTVTYVEFNNKGAGADRSKRVSWSRELTNKEAETFSKEKIFAPLGWEISSEKKWYEL
jgi:pectinesterase